MSADVWQIIAIISFSLAAVSLLITTFVFFRMRILSVIGDLSGKTVAREVSEMRKTGSSYRGKHSKSDQAVIEREMMAAKMPPTPVQMPDSLDQNEPSEKTDILKPADISAEVMDFTPTDRLSSVSAKGVPSFEKKKTQRSEKQQANALDFSARVSSALNQSSGILPKSGEAISFRVLRELCVIHTDEKIE